jgi:hypothetical protein
MRPGGHSGSELNQIFVTASAASVPGEEASEANEEGELPKGPGVKTRPKRTVKPNMKYNGQAGWTRRESQGVTSYN